MELHGSNGLNWSSIVYNIFKIVQNDPKWHKLSQNKPQMVKQNKKETKKSNIPKGLKLSKMVNNCQNDSKLSHIVQFGQEWSKMVQSGSS